jgi:hypothetical protein
MSSRLQLAALFCALFPAAFAQTGPAGHWEGTLQVPNREIQITVDLAQDAKGSWIGTFSQSQGGPNVPLADIRVADKNVKFRIAAGGPNAPDFNCNVDQPASMACTLNTPGGSLTTTLKRTGEAKVELPKSSPAVSPELEGNWEGGLDTANGTLRLVVHFKNQPDKTVKATMDSLDQNATDLPLTDIVQNGTSVEFQLKLVNGSYKGTLNKEGTQLTGEWTQGGSSLPLALKKSPAK